MSAATFLSMQLLVGPDGSNSFARETRINTGRNDAQSIAKYFCSVDSSDDDERVSISILRLIA